MHEDDAAAAVQVFRLNAAEFPQSGNVWDSLAVAYMKSGNLKQAEEYYQKALAQDATDQNAKDMLAKTGNPRKSEARYITVVGTRRVVSQVGYKWAMPKCRVRSSGRCPRTRTSSTEVHPR